MSDLKSPANRTPMQLTLRQLRENLCSPFFWMVLGAVILLASMAGPYFTLERFRCHEPGRELPLEMIRSKGASGHQHMVARGRFSTTPCRAKGDQRCRKS